VKKTLLAASILAVVALAGCVTQAQMNQSLANAATLIANGCKLVQPTLAATAVATADAPAAVAAGANGVFCASDTALANAAAAASASTAASAPVAASSPQ
jgi:outer membrane murein-binding lipoprotein Lpp